MLRSFSCCFSFTPYFGGCDYVLHRTFYCNVNMLFRKSKLWVMTRFSSLFCIIFTIRPDKAAPFVKRRPWRNSLLPTGRLYMSDAVFLYLLFVYESFFPSRFRETCILRAAHTSAVTEIHNTIRSLSRFFFSIVDYLSTCLTLVFSLRADSGKNSDSGLRKSRQPGKAKARSVHC